METQPRPAMWKTLLAFAIIYFVWGSTFLAIRVGVHEVPPLLFAAMRFLFAGIVLYGWMIARGERSPTPRQWTSVSLLAVLIFVLDYGSLFCAEQPVPASQVMRSGAQMLAGGVFLSLPAAALGEFHNFHPTTVSREVWLSLLYLIVAGSIIGFTAYVWLLHHESPTKVGTYAYVNPIVAVVLGYFLGGEELGLRTILGTLFVLINVVLITTTKATKITSATVSAETD